jgi:hypothetical protein
MKSKDVSVVTQNYIVLFLFIGEPTNTDTFNLHVYKAAGHYLNYSMIEPENPCPITSDG